MDKNKKRTDAADLLNAYHDRMAYLIERGRFGEALGYGLQAEELARQSDVQASLVYAYLLNDLAEAYRGQGDLKKAEAYYLQSLDASKAAAGELSPDTILGLNNLASLYSETGRTPEAISMLEQVIDMYQRIGHSQSTNAAIALHNLADAQQKTGHFEQASQLLEQSGEILKKTVGENHPYYATSLHSQARLYDDMGLLNEAARLYQRAAEIFRAAGGETYPQYLDTLATLARVRLAGSDVPGAEQALRQVYEIHLRHLGPDHPATRAARQKLSEFYTRTGNPAAARELAKPDSQPPASLAPEQIALIQQAYQQAMQDRGQGRFAEAAETAGEVLAALRRLLKEPDPNIAVALAFLGGIEGEMGNFAAARQHLRAAAEAWKSLGGEQTPEYAQALYQLAGVHYYTGNLPEARSLLLQAIALQREQSGESDPDYATSLNTLARIYTDQGEYDQALPLAEQAYKIRKAALGDAHPDLAHSLGNLGYLYFARGQARKAERSYRQALKILKKTLGKRNPAYLAVLNNLSILYTDQARYPEAEQGYQQVIEIARQVYGEVHPEIADGLHNLAILHVRVGDPGQAFQDLQQAAAIHARLIELVFSLASEEQRMAYLARINAHLSVFLGLVNDYLAHDTAARRAAMKLLLERKALGAEAFAAQRAAVLGGRLPKLRSQLEALDRLRAQIAQAMLDGPRGGDVNTHLNRIADQLIEKSRLEAELARQAPGLVRQGLQASLDLVQVAACLPPESVLVEFVRVTPFNFGYKAKPGESAWLPPRYLAFVLPSASLPSEADLPVAFFDLGEANAVDTLLDSFRHALGIGSNLREASSSPEEITSGSEKAGEELRRVVFDPLLPALGERRRLLLSPDGELNRLPYEVLPAPGEGWLIERYAFSYLSSGRDLLRSFPSIQPGPPLVLAAPDFDLSAAGTERAAPLVAGTRSADLERSGLHFRPLPGSLEEGRQVAGSLGVKPLLAGQALESRLKTARSPRILHLSTHGFFLKDQPPAVDPAPGSPASVPGVPDRARRLSGLENPLLRSGLALAGANTWLENGNLPVEAEDGLLTAEDVSALDLLATELVVLSACDTGLGEIRAGEGVFGLRRAFVLAGARTLVMSLWKVPDQQTRALMGLFYRALQSGQPPAEALRSAQLEVMKRSPEPRAWGAFICQG